MSTSGEYRYLKPKRGSRYRQLFVNGRIMAEMIYRLTVGREPLTPEQVASEYGLPVDAVLEAIHYSQHHPDVLDEDRRREAEIIKQDGRDHWPHAPRDYQPSPRACAAGEAVWQPWPAKLLHPPHKAAGVEPGPASLISSLAPAGRLRDIAPAPRATS